VIQQSMERISSFYHASATAPRTNHGDFFNTHRRLHSLTWSMSDMAMPTVGVTSGSTGRLPP